MGILDAPSLVNPKQVRPRGDVVFLGDSITNNTGLYTESPLFYQDGYPGHMIGQAGGALRSVRNAGISGNTSTQMLARFDTDVTPYLPGTVHLMCGTNDVLASFTLATMQSNVRAIVGKIRGIGAVPVLCTIPPCASTTTPQRLVLWQFNQWIRRYSQVQGITLLDLYRVLANPALAGGMLPAYDLDGTHPNVLGQMAMAAYAAPILAARTPGLAVHLVGEHTDAYSMLSGPTFSGAVTSGIAAGFVNYGNANTLGNTASVVTDALVPGSMQKITSTASSSNGTIGQNMTTSKFAVGNRISVAAVVTTTGTSTTAYAEIGVSHNGPGTSSRWRTTTPVTREIVNFEFVVPASTTSMDVTMRLNPGTGSMAVGQLSMYNLTTLGTI